MFLGNPKDSVWEEGTLGNNPVIHQESRLVIFKKKRVLTASVPFQILINWWSLYKLQVNFPNLNEYTFWLNMFS